MEASPALLEEWTAKTEIKREIYEYEELDNAKKKKKKKKKDDHDRTPNDEVHERALRPDPIVMDDDPTKFNGASLDEIRRLALPSLDRGGKKKSRHSPAVRFLCVASRTFGNECMGDGADSTYGRSVPGSG
ncbi:hypothetical protein VTN00DRAFT_5855 [Thermoascus crustaceus]|uniref:uncharacterized protein n=1 Tax=Thermoascus crustaceus TaxID=5088 RepID=UPI00374263E1